MRYIDSKEIVFKEIPSRGIKKFILRCNIAKKMWSLRNDDDVIVFGLLHVLKSMFKTIFYPDQVKKIFGKNARVLKGTFYIEEVDKKMYGVQFVQKGESPCIQLAIQEINKTLKKENINVRVKEIE